LDPELLTAVAAALVAVALLDASPDIPHN
jgi:hypothetical protein